LGVFGLSGTTTEKDLEDEFSKHGKVEKVELIMDKRTQRSRCFGFLYFATVEDAARAKENCNGMRLHGRNIRTDFSYTTKAHSPTPGQYMGKVTRRYAPRRFDNRYNRSPRRYEPYYDDRRYEERRYDDRRYEDRRYDDRERFDHRSSGYRGERERYDDRDRY